MTASALDGAGLLDSLEDLSCSLRDGDWLAAGLAGASTAIDTVAAVLDPLGSLLGAGLGWLMEHLEPLKGWLDDLTGDAGEVADIAARWRGVGGQLGEAADDLARLVRADFELMSGASIDAYVRYADDLAAHLRGIGDSSGAVGSALAVCSTVVQVVHDLVRDTVAQLVGSIISWVTEATLSVGLATPWIVSQVVSRVSSLASKVGRSVIDVVSSAKALKALVEAVDAVLARVTRRLRNPGVPDAPALFVPRRLDGSVSVGGTRPSAPANALATPRGRPARFIEADDPVTVRGRTRENESAVTLAQHGFDVEQSPTTPDLKNPDFRIEGEIFDNYAPATGSPRAIWTAVAKKLSEDQTRRIVLNLDDSRVGLDVLEAQFTTYPIDGLLEVIVVRGGAVIHMIPR